MSFALSKIRVNQLGGILHFGMPKTIQRNASLHSFSSSFEFLKASSHLTCGRVKRESVLISNGTSKTTTFKSSFAGFTALLSFSTFSAMINQQNSSGDTPLHLGVKVHVFDSRYEICKILLQRGADPNIPDFAGKTPLDTAIKQGSQDMIELLTSYGALWSNR